MEDYDPSDAQDLEQRQRDATKAQRDEAKEIADDTKWLMSSKRGRRILWRLLSDAGVFKSTFHTTAMQMAFNEGQRNAGLRTLALINEHCPDLYTTMMQEQKA